jgi:hypothetical protein
MGRRRQKLVGKLKEKRRNWSLKGRYYIALSGALALLETMEAVPWLRQLVAGLPPRRPGFDLGSVHVGFVVDEVALG